MHQLYILIEETAIGPFTGVELREAALAGVVNWGDVIGAGPDGPWYRASDIGLFDKESKTVLPHPPGTFVPEYFVRNVPGSRESAYQLNELILLAARQRLPHTAELQIRDSNQWQSVHRLLILQACLTNWLRLTDKHSGDTTQPDQSLGFAKATQTQPQDSDNVPAAFMVKASKWTRLKRFLARPQARIGIACGLIALLALVFVIWSNSNTVISQDQIIGQWVAYESAGDDDIATLGIRFSQAGDFVACNATGPSWTGRYELSDFQIDNQGIGTDEPITSTIDQSSSNHLRGNVLRSDGHIRLSGFVKDPPNLAGHAVRDFFVRRDDEHLLVGYPLAVHFDSDGSNTEVAWIRLMRKENVHSGLMSDLAGMDQQVVLDADGSSPRPRHVADAIAVAEEGYEVEFNGKTVTLRQSPAYSKVVTIAWLLDRYGVPDEARPLLPYEIPTLENSEAERLTDANLIRYQELKLVFSRDGSLVYLGIGSKAWMPTIR
ncbi:hypothetical protein Pla22_12120 [Rubripirellula amarantea]|uniref:GYF domain-containing protein n=1 Tax=Rubripirellula amarantea TaxID=2527999 RepID=A0A5C5WUC8_9BACT|nr:hypothetical protein [Rubripirellula amarantea]TWT53583.1 hypothetical protein Pla22_12120 [Rubripirellula amarantea]